MRAKKRKKKKEHSVVPGMALYDSQGEDVDMDVDIDFSQAGTATGRAEHSLSLDGAQESTNIDRNFSPATK